MSIGRVQRPVAAAIVALGAGGIAQAVAGSGPAAAAGRSKTAVVHASMVAKVGDVLVDSAGRTLYVFSKDSAGHSRCTGTCAGVWSPLLAKGKVTVGHGARRSLIGEIMRPGGQHQVTYDHRPLYTYVADTGSGQAHGQGVIGFGGKWSTISPMGHAVTARSSSSHSSWSSSSSPSTTPSSGGYGY